jgi:TetR/AcrR family transcriptional regulator, transcriptional repressor for nem operon
MGRASTQQAASNRQAVLDAASQLLRAVGPDRLGVRECMTAAGLTHGAFSKQFASKEVLVDEACAHAFDGAERAFTAIMQSGSAGRDRRLVEYYLGPKPAEHACPLATLSIDAARAPEGSALPETFAHGLKRLAEVIVGEATEPERLVLLAAMVGASILDKASRDEDFTEKMKAAVAAYGDTIAPRAA